MHLLPRNIVMFDFIWTLPVQLWGTWNKWTLQKILFHGRIRTTNTATRFPACPSDHSATETVDDIRLKLSQYLFTLRYHKNSLVPCAKEYTENENKIIANLQFGDWYHLNTRWLTQKKKFIMSYVSYLFFFIYYCLYCLYHNLFLYIISL